MNKMPEAVEDVLEHSERRFYCGRHRRFCIIRETHSALTAPASAPDAGECVICERPAGDKTHQPGMFYHHTAALAAPAPALGALVGICPECHAEGWLSHGHCLRCRAPAPALDVERLARALARWWSGLPDTDSKPGSAWMRDARTIAAEYAAQEAPPDKRMMHLYPIEMWTGRPEADRV